MNTYDGEKKGALGKNEDREKSKRTENKKKEKKQSPKKKKNSERKRGKKGPRIGGGEKCFT